MPTIFLRIFLIYNLVNTFLLSLARKSLRPLLLPSSWFPANLLQTLVYQTSQTTETENLVVSGSKDQLVQGLSVGPPPPLPQARLVGMDRNELRRMFQMFDKNGDGRITKQELTESLESLGIFIPDKELLSMIQRIDVNSDGCVDIDEFGALYQSIMESRDSEEEEDMKEAFNVFDQNGDGFITVDELRSVLSALGLKQGRAIDDCKTMIMKVDVDGDGRVNYNEFKQMMKGGGFNALRSN